MMNEQQPMDGSPDTQWQDPRKPVPPLGPSERQRELEAALRLMDDIYHAALNEDDSDGWETCHEIMEVANALLTACQKRRPPVTQGPGGRPICAKCGTEEGVHGGCDCGHLAAAIPTPEDATGGPDASPAGNEAGPRHLTPESGSFCSLHGTEKHPGCEECKLY